MARRYQTSLSRAQLVARARLGGLARAERLSPRRRLEIARIAYAARMARERERESIKAAEPANSPDGDKAA